MSLYLSNLLKWVESPDLDRTWTAFLTHTTEEYFTILKDIDLGELFTSFCVDSCAFIVVPYILVGANNENFIRFSWHVADPGELNCSLVEVFVLVPHLRFFLQ